MPARTRTRAGNLPAELTSFVGRRHERATVKRLLSSYRLVTLTGIGGVGKTRLAAHVAAEVARAFSDDVWLVELDRLSDPTLVERAVAGALGVRESPGTPPLQLLKEYLAERQALLVLDNCEHLLDEVAKLVEELFRWCPGLRVVATSREALNIDGEATLPLLPLPAPDDADMGTVRELSRFDAVTLFVDRAAAVVPEFALTERNRAAVAQLCRRLDGLPLAIELVAAWLRTLSPEQIVMRLSAGHDLLTLGPRTAGERQRTMRASVTWSYELCTPAERLLWTRLTVFAGGAELDAIEGVCVGDGLAVEDIADLLAALIGKSIVVREETASVSRYRLLEVIGEFGRARSRDAGEYERLRRRHRDWYADLAQRAQGDLFGPHQVAWRARLDRDMPNLRAALQFCLDEDGEATAGLRLCTAMQFYWNQVELTEGRHWCDRMLARASGKASRERVAVLYLSALTAGIQGDVAQASELAAQAGDLAEQLDDHLARAIATQASAIAALFGGDLDTAAAGFEQILDTYRAAGAVSRLLETLTELTLCHGLRGNWARAVECHDEEVALAESHGDLWYRSYAHYALGIGACRKGDPELAGTLLHEALRLKRQVDDSTGEVMCLMGLAWAAARRGEHSRAAVLRGATESLARHVGTQPVFLDLAVLKEECERLARDGLGPRRFDAAFSRGQQLDTAQAIAYALDEKPPQPPTAPHTETILTPREQEVAHLVAEGLTNKQIAAQLVISRRTAETHVEHILNKLGLTSRAGIAAWTRERP